MKIAHASDIQIRALKRHDEFKQHFNNFYNSLKKNKIDAIVLVGDVVHQKSFITAELIRICSNFFTNLANIAPLYVIPGNHDLVMNNLSRLDTLTPIFEALNNPNIHYYKHSGIYAINDFINFVHFSCFENENLWPKKEEINKSVINIGLYHGFVEGAILQNGMQVYQDAHKVNDFLKVVDYLFLGDIHKMQLLDAKYKSAYCGSLIQQNYGESINKGYLLWDIKSKNEHDVDFIELPNISPFYTLKIKDDLKLPKENLQENCRIRIFSKQLNVVEKDNLKNQIIDIYHPTEIKFVDDVNAHKQEVKINSEITIEKLNDLIVQEKLLKDFFKPYELKSDIMFKILDINKKYNNLINQNDKIRNITYKINKIYWDNLCSFAEDNCINFNNYKGILGIFGNNGSGKSTAAVDVLSYSLYNKISKKITKNDLLINENKKYCSSILELTDSKNKYKIIRSTCQYIKSGKKNKNPVIQGKTDVDFYINDEIKNGEERSITDNEIRRIFGTYDDFVVTTVSPQWQLLDFIEKGSTDRQKLIGKYFDIDIFEEKFKLAKENIKELKTKIKFYKEYNFNNLIKENSLKLDDINAKLLYAKNKQAINNKKISILEKKIENIQSHIKQIDIDESINEETFLTKLTKSKVEIINQRNKLENLQNDVSNLEKEIENLEKENYKISIDDNVKILNNFNQNQFLIEENKKNKSNILLQLENIENKINDLNKYKCLSNDDCCMLEEISKINIEKNKFKKEYEASLLLIDNLIKKDFNIEIVKEEIEKFNKNKQKLIEKTPLLSIKKNKIKSECFILNQMENNIVGLKNKFSLYKKNKKQIERNKTLFLELEEIRKNKSICNESLQNILQEIIDYSTRKNSIQEKLEIYIKQKEELQELEKEYEAYDYFIHAMGKDGLSRIIIRNNLNIINKQLKNILSHSVDFNIKLDVSDNGKEIEIFFKSPKSPQRRIELTSGMEKTIAAIAIRAALISVTTLPKFNIFILDESFNALDSEYMDSIAKILEYLKQIFDTVVIITHNDVLKDIVDHVIEIERNEQGYSKICQ